MIYFQSEFAVVHYDAKIPLIELEWIAYARSEQFRTAFESALGAFAVHKKTHKHLYFLTNSLKMKVIGPEDVEWMNLEINPKLVEHGLRFMAMILPESIFATTAVEEYERNTTSIKIENFTNRNDAVKWLKKLSGDSNPPKAKVKKKITSKKK